jgi:hypothetical protein
MPIITLLTDYGTADSYVAEVKGVILSAAPGVTLVDVTHEVPPGKVMAAQYIVSRTWQRFPAGTVHLVVVDPGVGTERRALAAESAGHRFVAPDNGVLSSLSPEARFVSLPVAPGISATFHGRDVFAPAAARLAGGGGGGARLEDLGSVIADPIRSPLPTPLLLEGWIAGEVVYVDRFGTLITNIPGAQVRRIATIMVAETAVGSLRRTFTDVASGEVVAFVGSAGTVEIAVRDGSAAQRLGFTVGAPVRAATR